MANNNNNNNYKSSKSWQDIISDRLKEQEIKRRHPNNPDEAKKQINNFYANKQRQINKNKENRSKLPVGVLLAKNAGNMFGKYLESHSGKIENINSNVLPAPVAAVAAAQAAAPAAAVAAPVAAASSGWFSGPGWSLDPRQWNRYRPSIEAAEKERKERGTSGSSNNRKSWTNMSQNEQNAKVAGWGSANTEKIQEEIANAQAAAAKEEAEHPFNSNALNNNADNNAEGGRRRRSRKATRKGRKATRKGRKAMRKNRTSRR
jgi:hypothetical protein